MLPREYNTNTSHYDVKNKLTLVGTTLEDSVSLILTSSLLPSALLFVRVPLASLIFLFGPLLLLRFKSILSLSSLEIWDELSPTELSPPIHILLINLGISLKLLSSIDLWAGELLPEFSLGIYRLEVGLKTYSIYQMKGPYQNFRFGLYQTPYP